MGLETRFENRPRGLGIIEFLHLSLEQGSAGPAATENLNFPSKLEQYGLTFSLA